MIFRDPNGKEIGDYDTSTQIYTRKVSRNYQKEKDAGGWALEIGVIDTLFAIACEKLQIVDTKGKCSYRISLENFTRNGTLIEGDYGQRILVKDEYWETIPLRN